MFLSPGPSEAMMQAILPDWYSQLVEEEGVMSSYY
jgi:hypothetical protein